MVDVVDAGMVGSHKVCQVMPEGDEMPILVDRKELSGGLVIW